MDKEKGTWGGHREGSGRKKSIFCKKVQIRLNKDEFLLAQKKIENIGITISTFCKKAVIKVLQEDLL